MGQEDLKDAIRVVLFLAIIHRPATIHEIALATGRPKSYMASVLCRLDMANIVFLVPYGSESYTLQKRSEPVTLKDVERAMKVSVRKMFA